MSTLTLLSRAGTPAGPRLRKAPATGALLATLAMLVATSTAHAALVADTFSRSDGTPAQDSLGTTEVGGFDWLEKPTNAGVTDVAEITGGELLVRGVGVGTSNPGEAVVDADLPNGVVRATLRFDLSNPSATSTYNNAGFMLRKPRLDATIVASNSIGQIEVSFFPTGGLFIREMTSGGAVIRYSENPFATGTAVTDFAAAGSLPATINGAPFDVNQDGRLDGSEPFQLSAILSSNRLQVLINDEPIAAVNAVSSTAASPNNYLALWKNRYTSSGTRTNANPYFDNFSAGDLSFVIRHRGDTDPLLENWIRNPGSVAILEGPVTGDMGHDAWNINDNSTAGGSLLSYSTTPTVEEMEKAAAQGWIMSGLIRVIGTSDPADFSISLDYTSQVASLNKRFSLGLGSTADGDPIATFYGGSTVTLTGLGDGYHLYEMKYDPQSATASLFVDGTEWMSGFAGTTNPGIARILWGANQSSSTGNANYAFVQFQIVPEPSSLALLGLGVLGLMFGWRRRGRR